MSTNRRTTSTPHHIDAVLAMGLPVYALDWKPKKLDVIDIREFKTGTVAPTVILTTLEEFIRVRSPCVIILEATFGSFNPVGHNDSMDLAVLLDTLLRTLPPRGTGKNARELFDDFNPKKDDAHSVEAMTRLILRGVHLAKARKWVIPPSTVRNDYELHRRAGVFTDRNDPWVKEQMALFPAFADLPDFARRSFGDRAGKRYDLPYVLSLIPAFAEGRDGKPPRSSHDLMDRVISAHFHGYPSFYRSQFMRRGATIRQRIEKHKKGPFTAEERKLSNSVLKELRRSVVFLYHRSHQSISNLPVKTRERPTDPDATTLPVERFGAEQNTYLPSEARATGFAPEPLDVSNESQQSKFDLSEDIRKSTSNLVATSPSGSP